MKRIFCSITITLLYTTLVAQGQNCIDIPNMPTTQINNNINDDVNYPVGSAYWSSGNIEFIKNADSDPFNHSQGDTMFCIGSGMGIHLSFANAADPKTVNLNTHYELGLVVDGDTIYQNGTPPSSYTGSNFNYASTAMPSVHTITGSFDTVKVLNNGNLCISKICLEEGTQDCIDIPNMPTAQINNNINDDVNYPVGSAYWSSGNIEFIKNADSDPFNHSQGDTMFCIGSGMGIHLSFANATDPKTVVLNTFYEVGLVVDGDTIYQNGTPPPSYSGSNFNYSSTSMPSVHTITGSFDTVKVLNMGNLCISKICLEEGSVASTKEVFAVKEEVIKVFPNPIESNQEIFIKSAQKIDEIFITNVSGKTVYRNKTSSQEINLVLDDQYTSGVYFVSVLIDHKWHQKKLVVK